MSRINWDFVRGMNLNSFRFTSPSPLVNAPYLDEEKARIEEVIADALTCGGIPGLLEAIGSCCENFAQTDGNINPTMLEAGIDLKQIAQKIRDNYLTNK